MAQITAFKDGDKGSGKYTVHVDDRAANAIWAIRETPIKHYKDDVLFRTDQTESGCVVTAKSRS